MVSLGVLPLFEKTEEITALKMGDVIEMNGKWAAPDSYKDTASSEKFVRANIMSSSHGDDAKKTIFHISFRWNYGQCPDKIAVVLNTMVRSKLIEIIVNYLNILYLSKLFKYNVVNIVI